MSNSTIFTDIKQLLTKEKERLQKELERVEKTLRELFPVPFPEAQNAPPVVRHKPMGKLMCVTDAAKSLSMKAYKIYRLIEKNKIPCVIRHGIKMVDPDQILDLMTSPAGSGSPQLSNQEKYGNVSRAYVRWWNKQAPNTSFDITKITRLVSVEEKMPFKTQTTYDQCGKLYREGFLGRSSPGFYFRKDQNPVEDDNSTEVAST